MAEFEGGSNLCVVGGWARRVVTKVEDSTPAPEATIVEGWVAPSPRVIDAERADWEERQDVEAAKIVAAKKRLEVLKSSGATLPTPTIPSMTSVEARLSTLGATRKNPPVLTRRQLWVAQFGDEGAPKSPAKFVKK